MSMFAALLDTNTPDDYLPGLCQSPTYTTELLPDGNLNDTYHYTPPRAARTMEHVTIHRDATTGNGLKLTVNG